VGPLGKVQPSFGQAPRFAKLPGARTLSAMNTRPHTLAHRSLGLLAALALLSISPPAEAAAPTMSVQGRLLGAGGGAVADGAYDITFRLYTQQVGGQALWTETAAKLPVKGGAFMHALGSVKTLSPALLGTGKGRWLGLQVGVEPELSRNPLHAAPYALRAELADGIACTGCVSLSSLKADGDLDLGGNAVKAKLVSAGSLVANNISAQALSGDGSKLTGIKLPAGTCPQGQVAVGVQSSGKLSCSAVAGGGGSLEQISGGLLTTEYAQPTASKTVPKPISDNNPIGTVDEIDIADIGVVKKLTVSIKISNSDLSGVQVLLYDPLNAKHVLHSGKPGKTLTATYPSPDKPVSGNLGAWVGKNPKGKWRLRVIDSKFLNNGNDGAIEAWSIDLLAGVSKQVTSKGTFLAAGGLIHQSTSGPPMKCDETKIGQMYLDQKDKRLYYCDGDWRKLLIEALCGNKIINPGETCDDGNTKDGDGCTAKCQKNVCGDGVLHTGVEACDDGNLKAGDGCSAKCQLESKTFKGYANWSQNVNAQSDAVQDAAMDQACKNKYGGNTVAATMDEILNKKTKIKTLPATNGSGQHLLGKCPQCAGNNNGSAKSGHCRKCVDPNKAWPTNLNSGWNPNCCNSTRSAICLQ